MAEENKTIPKKLPILAGKRGVKPDLPGGFRDYRFSEAVVKQKIIDVFRRTAEKFGFEPLETSSVQRTEVLVGGEKTSDKIIYRIKPAQRGELVGEETKDENSLRFDLTVPLARFLADNPDTPKPFKRYEVGRVWRGERQQAGRYREFTQADVDIVGSSWLGADAEILSFTSAVLKSLDLNNFKIKINFRDEAVKLLKKYGVAEKKQNPTLIEVDKKEKLPLREWWERIKQASGLEERELLNYIKELSRGPSPRSKYDELKKLAIGFGADEDKLEYDGTVVRGLAYYTGTVFETILTDYPEIGSVFSGGRYDNLMESFTGQKIPAVGISLGVDRLLIALEKTNKTFLEKGPTRVLVLRLLNAVEEYAEILNNLRRAGFNTAFYLGKENALKAQLTYALKKEIPYVLIYGEEEKKKRVVAIKNLQTREQKEISKSKIVEYLKTAI